MEKIDSKIIYILLAIFLITEIIDDTLDTFFIQNRFFHSIFQIFLFILLFFITIRVFSLHYKNKVKSLLPEELRVILLSLNEAKMNGILFNQSKLMKKLNITKPTIKKRISTLIELGYIKYEKVGNNKYLILTSMGEGLLK